jgi:hypothetical protein
MRAELEVVLQSAQCVTCLAESMQRRSRANEFYRRCAFADCRRDSGADTMRLHFYPIIA